MSTLYYVNPADTNDITRLGDPPLGRTTLPDGRTVESLDGPVVEWDVYGSQPDPAQRPVYYRKTGETYQFIGPEKTEGSYVQITDVNTRYTLDELFTDKYAELEDYTSAVLDSSFRVTGLGGTDFWAAARTANRFAYSDVDRFYQYNPSDPWRNVPVYLARTDNGKRTRVKVDANDYASFSKQFATFTYNGLYANDEVLENMEAAYDASDWDALAAIDIATNPTTNTWPEFSSDAFGQPTRPEPDAPPQSAGDNGKGKGRGRP